MKLRLRGFATLAALTAASLALPALAAPPAQIAASQAKKDDKKKKGAELPMPAPKGLTFGLKLNNLSDFYEKYWDQKFLPRFKTATPGVETESLEQELRDVKRLIKRTHLKFGKTPTGIDQTPLNGEYSYLNGESLSRLQLDKTKKRYFFFFESRGLWKVYDEYQLSPKGPLGASFEEAVAILSKKFNRKPTRLKADFAQGRPLDEAVWTDKKLIIRLVDREYQKVAGLVYVDKQTQDDLAKLRRNKPPKEKIDPSVKNATTKEPPKDPKNKKK
jgi:hypothetical protein